MQTRSGPVEDAAKSENFDIEKCAPFKTDQKGPKTWYIMQAIFSTT